MKKIIPQIFIVLLCFSAQAQKVSNIRAEQHGQDIVVLYSLETTSPCEVSLLLSQDNGVTWGSPLKNVSGDVGKNISAGEKQITWKVAEELEYLVGDKMKFKVIANGRKSFEPEMIFVQGGTFLIGNSNGNRLEKPVHSVELSSFYIGKYEVTRELWIEIMGSDLGVFRDCKLCPIDCVNWLDAQDFIKKLNAKTGKSYRLPTEAEWEYAARGGKMNCSFKYSGSDNLDEVGWYVENSFGHTHPVGSKKANCLGVYDMSGNVLEWCSDWYEEYKQVSILNPLGPTKGFGRVVRGGRWEADDESCGVSFRYGFEPDESNYFFGFRLALSDN
jgi:formylglycine-generating enzyme required for sulfatase activity